MKQIIDLSWHWIKYMFNVQNTMYLDKDNVFERVPFKDYYFHEMLIKNWKNSETDQKMLEYSEFDYYGPLFAGVIKPHILKENALFWKGFAMAKKRYNPDTVHPEPKFKVSTEEVTPDGMIVFEDIK